MANTDQIIKSAEAQSKVLAQKLLQQYTQQASSDAIDYLQNLRDDLDSWTAALEQNQMDKDEFASCVRGEKDLAEMRALKQAGLAQVSIDTFTNGVIQIVIDAAFAALKI